LFFFFFIRRLFLNLIGNKIGAGTTLHRDITFFSIKGLVVGSYCTINPGCYLDGRGGLFIGNNVNISHDVKIYSMGHDITSQNFKSFIAPVKIGDNCWIFPHSLIMPGVNIGAGSVVLPGSVVTKSCPNNSVIGGNPATVVKVNSRVINYKASFPIHFSK
jgi:maltose O-acetyltransferase